MERCAARAATTPCSRCARTARSGASTPCCARSCGSGRISCSPPGSRRTRPWRRAWTWPSRYQACGRPALSTRSCAGSPPATSAPGWRSWHHPVPTIRSAISPSAIATPGGLSPRWPPRSATPLTGRLPRQKRCSGPITPGRASRWRPRRARWRPASSPRPARRRLAGRRMARTCRKATRPTCPRSLTAGPWSRTKPVSLPRSR